MTDFVLWRKEDVWSVRSVNIRVSSQSGFMPKPVKKQSGDESPSSGNCRPMAADFSFEVEEWLESERLEHEKRMQGLGCSADLDNKRETRKEKASQS